MQMLLEDAKRILNRHLVPGERHHPRAEFHLQRVQWGCFEARLVQSGLPARLRGWHQRSTRGFFGRRLQRHQAE
jgi:hypothetical protein